MIFRKNLSSGNKASESRTIIAVNTTELEEKIWIEVVEDITFPTIPVIPSNSQEIGESRPGIQLQ